MYQWWSTDHTLVTMTGLPEGPPGPVAPPCGMLLAQATFLVGGRLHLDVDDFTV